jgi:hypothetical protein
MATSGTVARRAGGGYQATRPAGESTKAHDIDFLFLDRQCANKEFAGVLRKPIDIAV